MIPSDTYDADLALLQSQEPLASEEQLIALRDKYKDYNGDYRPDILKGILRHPSCSQRLWLPLAFSFCEDAVQNPVLLLWMLADPLLGANTYVNNDWSLLAHAAQQQELDAIARWMHWLWIEKSWKRNKAYLRKDPSLRFYYLYNAVTQYREETSRKWGHPNFRRTDWSFAV